MFDPTISQSMQEAIRRTGFPMPQPTSSTRIPGRIPASSQTRSVWTSSACARLCQPPGKNPK
jgi:hypothetical protein